MHQEFARSSFQSRQVSPSAESTCVGQLHGRQVPRAHSEALTQSRINSITSNSHQPTRCGLHES
eukprot:m.140461 g.140461  ORF g.140461 m.140461 type:complete len:64 (+) comp22800_c0_seq4:101-292(+)